MWISSLLIILIGTFLHFLYEISNHNKIVALFAAVNESTWEHIKLALTPMFFLMIYDIFCYGNNPNYFIAKVTSILTVIILIPLLFYGYSRFFKSNLVIDIGIFCISVIISQYLFYIIMKLESLPDWLKNISIILLFIIFGFYLLATLMPLKNELFKDPITDEYGIKEYK